ncbi:penicillin-binding protein 1A [Lachnotalea glycerini]|uniref:Penicillin-binding protein 1A n=1 Tax=Lachnotalea glycerini TaxID=1763509 RepID=A0A318EMY7_9FIRM|nr:PBP1A family penicillin-binding protein [Lachnotalea glycerini]PXV86300.1 penicillin-binding protein 1A [Lachnotalea glycerini]
MNYGKKGASDKQKALTSKTNKVGRKVIVTIFKVFIVCFLATAVIGSCAAIGIIKGVIDSAPEISTYDVTPKKYSTAVYDQDGNEITKLVASGSNRVSKSIDEIPKNLQNAFVAIEDERFWEHNGIDIKGIIRAGVLGITSGNFSEGASTITQQLLKNNVFEGWTEEKSLTDKFKRKIQEQYLAIQLEKSMSKEVILENYLNAINLGQNTLGVQAASLRYFNKDVSELTLSECAVIAGITQNPYRYNPISNPENNAERRKKVLGNMLEQGYISQDEYDEALADDVYSRIKTVNTEIVSSSVYTYFVDELTDQVMKDLQEQKGYTQTQAYNALYSSGLSIYTTQDKRIQTICDEEFANSDNYPKGTEVALTYRLTVTSKDGTVANYSEDSLKDYFKEIDGISYNTVFDSEEEANAQIERYKEAILKEGDEIDESITLTPQPQASCVIMDQATGYVKAIVGGRGTKEASLTLNRATDTKRQPGSTFKVLSTYAPALDTAGMTLATVHDDSEYNYASGRPVSNWYSTGYRGLTTIRDAITYSMNIVTVKTLTEITPQLGYDYLLKFGFTTLVNSRKQADGTVMTDITQSLALGGITDGVTNLELTAAYATIANGGTYTKPIFYTKILDHDGNVLIDNTPKTTTVIKDTTAFLLTSAMEDVVKVGTGKSLNFGTMPIAGKTGTTSDYRDLWFSGFTPYYTCTVWGGYDTNDKMSSSTSFHKVLWKNIMSRVHEGLERKEFTIPDNIETAVICKKSGKLAVTGLCDCDPRGSMAITEYFAKGTAPTEVCDTHIKLATCTLTGLPASPYCPEVTYNSDQVYIIRPTGSTGVTDDTQYELPADYSQNMCPIHSSASSHLDSNYYYNRLPEYSTDTNTTTDSTNSTGTTTDDTTNTTGGSQTTPDAGVNSIIDSTNSTDTQTTTDNQTPTQNPVSP